MKLRVLFLLLLFHFNIFSNAWRVLVYMDASDNLNDMAIKNITDMLRVQPNDSVDFLLHLHSYQEVALQYKITKKGLTFLDEIALTGDSKTDFINAAEFAFSDNDADHTMIVLWNHGWGILDPKWNEHLQEWDVTSYPLKKKNICRAKRGFMFSASPRTYMNNQDMVEGLEYITNNLLNGKKIDILAFDTCMGAMLEVMYQVAPYTHYLVGNQVCSLRDGFDYHAIMNLFNQNLKPREMAIQMVNVFDEYYNSHDEEGIYAHSALDSYYVHSVTRILDEIVSELLKRPDYKEIVVKANNASPRFCIFPMYTDLVSFIKQIENQIQDESCMLVQSIQDLYEVMNHFVIAHCKGYTNKQRTHGCSIYLPTVTVDESYARTLFAENTHWFEILESIAQ